MTEALWLSVRLSVYLLAMVVTSNHQHQDDQDQGQASGRAESRGTEKVEPSLMEPPRTSSTAPCLGPVRVLARACQAAAHRHSTTAQHAPCCLCCAVLCCAAGPDKDSSQPRGHGLSASPGVSGSNAAAPHMPRDPAGPRVTTAAVTQRCAVHLAPATADFSGHVPLLLLRRGHA